MTVDDVPDHQPKEADGETPDTSLLTVHHIVYEDMLASPSGSMIPTAAPCPIL